MRMAWSSVLAMAALLTSIPIAAQTCGSAPAVPVVKRSFKLTVMDSTKTPESGVKVTLGKLDQYHAMHPVSVGDTDPNGVLNFVKVPPGQYTFRFTDASGERQLFYVEVADSGQDSVEYTWPYVMWVPVRTASAFLMSGQQPLRHYKVTLLGYPDANELGVSDTDLYGRFDLPSVSAGRYYVDVAVPDTTTGNAKSIGRIPINVTLNSRYPEVDPIFVEPSACGLVYDHYCTLPTAKAVGSCIQTVDAQGTAIPNASVTLKAKLTAVTSSSWHSDKDGNVKLPGLAAGDYDLQIFAKGYTPVRQTITLSPGEASCNTAIVIPMYEFGLGCVPPQQRKVN